MTFLFPSAVFADAHSTVVAALAADPVLLGLGVAVDDRPAVDRGSRPGGAELRLTVSWLCLHDGEDTLLGRLRVVLDGEQTACDLAGPAVLDRAAPALTGLRRDPDSSIRRIAARGASRGRRDFDVLLRVPARSR